MNPKLKLLGLFVLFVIALVVTRILTQEPKIWWDRQWAGLALYKGGYRSWTMTFCDGFTVSKLYDQSGNGHHLAKPEFARPTGSFNTRFAELQPVVITTNGYRNGYYRFPQFRHVNLKKMGILPPEKGSKP